MYCNSLDGPQFDMYKLTSEVQLLRWNEPDPGVFIAESARIIERALQAGYEPISVLSEEGKAEAEAMKLMTLFHKVQAPFYVSSKEVIEDMAGFHLARGMLCAMQRKPLPTMEEILAGNSRVAVLADVENPTNVGAIFRSAAAMGMEAVILTPGSCDPLYRRSSRVSMGTVFQIPWTFSARPGHMASPEQTHTMMETFRKNGFKTVALALRDDAISIEDAVLQKEEKLAIILGNEDGGISEDILKECDYTAIIPMKPGVDSLNVAAASAVAFWQLANRTF